ncbi:MAG: gliding motility protein GldM [Bacteroidota bacterium]
MSVPKEPRQLMINLMYIVLTALLALNVSAEVMNALFVIDESIQETNSLVAEENNQLLADITKQADAYPQFKIYQKQAEKVKATAKELDVFIEELRAILIDEAGGLDENDRPVRKDDKDITTRILVNSQKGFELEEMVKNTRLTLLEIIEDETAKQRFQQNLPLKINEIPADAEQKNWVDFTFNQMPLAAVLPLLSKFQNDLKLSEAALLKHFITKTGITRKQDAFTPVVAANKSYVIKNEPYEAAIFLGSYSSTVDNLSVTVDGRPLVVRDGKALFRANPNQLGIKKHLAKISLKDPLTGEIESFTKAFEYEVGERSATISADKMNVLYVGVDNPLCVSVAGVPSSQIRVIGDGVRVSKTGNGKYSTKPQRVGDVKITVSGGGLQPTTFEYRVKRIPNPVVKVGQKNGGNIRAAVFRAQRGIIPHLENFDFEARCKIGEFEMARVPRSGDAIVYENKGGGYDSRARRIVDQATRGDIFYFSKIKCKCLGDAVYRNLNGMVFNIQ